MPNEHGLTTYNTLMQHRPNLPVMFMSGFAVDEGINNLVSKGLVTLLTKPFTLYELSKGLSDLHAKADLRVAPHAAE
jgi:CheY-like chemotaxis protein